MHVNFRRIGIGHVQIKVELVNQMKIRLSDVQIEISMVDMRSLEKYHGNCNILGIGHDQNTNQAG